MMKRSKNQIDVSVVVPVYNAKKYLRQCLESLLQQSLDRIEIICVNDCSTDSSLRILNEFQKRDVRVKIIKNETNKGGGESRNIGMQQAKGEYLAFVDSDDFFAKDMLLLMYEKAVSEDADIVVCDYVMYDDQTGKHFECGVPLWFADRWENDGCLSDLNKLYVLNTVVHVPWNKLYRCSLVEQSKIKFQDLKYMDDTYFCSMILLVANKIVYMGKKIPALVNYRFNINSQSSNQGERDPIAPYKALFAIKIFLMKRPELHKYLRSFFDYILFYFMLSLGQLHGESQKVFYDFVKKKGLKELGLVTNSNSRFRSKSGNQQLALLGKSSYSQESIHRYMAAEYTHDLFVELQNCGYRCALWGFGKYGKAFWDKCIEFCYDLQAIVDESPLKQGVQIGNYEIQSFMTLNVDNIDAIIVTNPNFVKGIIRQVKHRKKDLRIIYVNSYCRCNIPFSECVY